MIALRGCQRKPELRVCVGQRDGGELHLDGESALGASGGGDCGVMGVSDCLDDRESETMTLGVARPCGIETLEGLEEPGELWGRDLLAVADDRENRVAMRGVGGDLDAAAGMVVADCVVNQVEDEAFREAS